LCGRRKKWIVGRGEKGKPEQRKRKLRDQKMVSKRHGPRGVGGKPDGRIPVPVGGERDHSDRERCRKRGSEKKGLQGKYGMEGKKKKTQGAAKKINLTAGKLATQRKNGRPKRRGRGVKVAKEKMYNGRPPGG